KGELDDLGTVGLETESAEAMNALAQRVSEYGIEVSSASDQQLAARHVKGMVRFVAPGGCPIEVYHGPEMATDEFRSEVIATHFLADELGLGHCVLRVNDLEVSEKFWCEVIGFKLSDHIITNIHGYDVNIAFLHTNPRHHSIALGAKLPKRVHHFMLQVGSLDDVGMAYDRTVDFRLRISQTLGRHPNDKMVSFYALTPSGFDFEYGWGAIEVDDSTWEPSVHDRISEWGHRRPPYPRPKRSDEA
ncbi:MAG: VOC family protein, partial [Myxococcales bacterium]|nr:VOC family protein [Myxococcales bacterium]